MAHHRVQCSDIKGGIAMRHKNIHKSNFMYGWRVYISFSISVYAYSHMSLISSAGLVTGYGMHGWSSIPGRGKRFFSTPQSLDGLWDPPSLQWVPGVKRAGPEADHSPPSNTQVKKGGATPPLPPICLQGILLNQAQGQLYLFYLPFTPTQNVVFWRGKMCCD
jgi:hypothetical protein